MMSLSCRFRDPIRHDVDPIVWASPSHSINPAWLQSAPLNEHEEEDESDLVGPIEGAGLLHVRSNIT